MTTKRVNSIPKCDDDDDSDEAKFGFPFATKKKPYQLYEQVYTATHLHFYLSEAIAEPDQYTDMIHRITRADASDTVFIHLNTNGGNLNTGVQLINAMQNSAAKIVTVLEAQAYSLGTLIFLAGDEMVVNDHCMMMFHNYSGGVEGKGNEQFAELDATIKWFNTLAKKIYVPFLTEEELADIIRGEDMWMQSSEIRKRLDRMIKRMNEPKPVKVAVIKKHTKPTES